METTPAPLSAAQLPHLRSTVRVPTYERSSLSPSIVHLGVGGFHRSHFAAYVDELCPAGHRDWAITGAGVLQADRRMQAALAEQDHLYTLIARGADTTTAAVIGSIIGFIGPDATAALSDRIADATTQIVSLTVTEGGYPIDDLTGEYAAGSPSAGADSAFGRLAAALARRRATSGAPLTVLSFDNINSNGNAARRSTLGEAAAIDPELVEWITKHVSFPNSMVDRITPSTTPADIGWLASEHALADQWPVVAEPFRQWVVEDEFAGNRLPFDDIDVIVTSDATPYELLKLRLLNAGHSCLAYLATLAGHTTVDEAMQDAAIRQFLVEFLHREARPALPHVEGVDIDNYISTLITRFSNPAIGDQLARLCLDGSSKFPKFLLPTVRSLLDQHERVDLSALAIAGWCEYLAPLAGPEVNSALAPDPLLDEARQRARASASDPAAFLGFSEVFGHDLASGPFRDAFVRSVESLRSGDVRSAIGAVLGEEGKHG